MDYLQHLDPKYSGPLAVFFLSLIAFMVFQKILVWRLRKLVEKTKTDIDDAILQIAASIKPPIYFFLSLYAASLYVDVPDATKEILRFLFFVLITYQFVRVVHVFIDFLVKKQARYQKDEGTTTAIETLGRIGKFLTWFVGALIVLQNVGINVSSIVAGLGIGGIAIALAAQNILVDLFSSFSIIFDKPFEVGDFIQVGQEMGTVERVGVKTTRIRALQGEEIVISNKELTSSRIQNYGKLKERRVSFSLGVSYETSEQKLKNIPKIVKAIMKDMEEVKFERAHLKDFGESSVNFEIVYLVKSNDYKKYMNIQENLNLTILSQFRKQGIEFAYPTRTVFVKK